MVSSQFKRLMLRQVFDSVTQGTSGSPSFYESLKAAAFSQLTITAKGRTVVSTAANGESVTFSMPGGADGLTPTAITELFEEFLTRYDDAVSDLGGAPQPDATIFATMMAYYRSVTGYTSNWQYLTK